MRNTFVLVPARRTAVRGSDEYGALNPIETL